MKSFTDYSVISTDYQTLGRGRFERIWKSDTKGNIYASIVIKKLPAYNEDSPISTITQFMAITIKDLLAEYVNNISIKWPNDILVNGKKICGILSNAVFSKNELDGVVIGFGINITNTHEELQLIEKPATSLLIECDKNVDKDELLKKIVDRFFFKLDSYLENGFEIIKNDYIMSSSTIGSTVTVDTPQGMLTGFAKGIDNRGILTIIDKNQNSNKITTGDVLWKEQLGQTD